MVCHYILLFSIIHYYDAIMTVIAIIALIAQFSVGEVSIFWELNAGMGSTPRVSCWRRLPANWSPRSVKDMDLEFLGSAHGLPTDETCLRWMSMTCRDSNSLLQWAHLKPNDIGNRFGPSGFPLPAPRRMLWIALPVNLLQFSASDPVDPNCSRGETGIQYNTKRIRTTLCIAIASNGDGSMAWMCTHPGRFQILNFWKKKNQNLSRLTDKLMRTI